MAIQIRTGQVAGFDEQVRDVVGAALVAGDGATVAVSDAGDTITVSAAGSGELLMQDGVSSPPVPLETEDGTDWLYEG